MKPGVRDEMSSFFKRDLRAKSTGGPAPRGSLTAKQRRLLSTLASPTRSEGAAVDSLLQTRVPMHLEDKAMEYGAEQALRDEYNAPGKRAKLRTGTGVEVGHARAMQNEIGRLKIKMRREGLTADEKERLVALAESLDFLMGG